ncbi:hypothetical protein DSL92_08015 [Billgrantia gudaonensis]|uniref:Uncharacterized protein n=1 Tax=Billgrantia gudaonensis TaxID=376427 RepID=A0A432JGI5_9GAMM|nr:hypothetical protein DSL92_08015 [Halomonas gudaonensis]
MYLLSSALPCSPQVKHLFQIFMTRVREVMMGSFTKKVQSLIKEGTTGRYSDGKRFVPDDPRGSASLLDDGTRSLESAESLRWKSAMTFPWPMLA